MLKLSQTQILLLIIALITVLVWWFFVLGKKTTAIVWETEGVDSNNDGFIDTLVPLNVNDFSRRLYDAISAYGYNGLNPLLVRMRNMPPKTLNALNVYWGNNYAGKGIAGTTILSIGSLHDAIANEFCGLTELDCAMQSEIMYLLQQNSL